MRFHERGDDILVVDVHHGVRTSRPQNGATMPKAYWISCYRSVSDEERLRRYVELASPAIARAGGRFLARGKAAHAFEAGVTERTTLIEFDSVEVALAAHESADYQAALEALGDGAERDLRIVEAIA